MGYNLYLLFFLRSSCIFFGVTLVFLYCQKLHYYIFLKHVFWGFVGYFCVFVIFENLFNNLICSCVQSFISGLLICHFEYLIIWFSRILRGNICVFRCIFKYFFKICILRNLYMFLFLELKYKFKEPFEAVLVHIHRCQCQWTGFADCRTAYKVLSNNRPKPVKPQV